MLPELFELLTVFEAEYSAGPTAGTLVGVTSLWQPDLLIEIAVVAVV